MDPRTLDYLLTPEEEEAFERDGFFVMENALPPGKVEHFRTITQDVVEEFKRVHGIPMDRYHGVMDFIGQRDGLLELVDWYRTLPKVWGILGPDIKLYHTVGMQTPKSSKYTSNNHHEWVNWHTDTGNLTRDLAFGDYVPRISIKVGYVLSDLPEANMANFTCLPGSHKSRNFPLPVRDRLTDDAVQVTAKAGDAIIFDRRLWHTPTVNTSDTTRYVIFNGYSFRWLANRDNQQIDHFLHRASPIQKQLLGYSHHGAYGSSNSFADDLPLKAWIEEHAPQWAERWPAHP